MKTYSTQAALSIWFRGVKLNSKSTALRSLVQGVGNNDSDHNTAIVINGYNVKDPAYVLWQSILCRGYSEVFKSKHPTYEETTVCKEWRTFSKFKSWFIDNHVDGYDLDKDLLVLGNKQYSPETCIFIPPWLNNFTIDCGSLRGNCTIGVNMDSNNYRARCSNPKTKIRESLGNFTNEQQAHEAWLNRKLEIAYELKSEMDEIDVRIYPNIVDIVKSKI